MLENFYMTTSDEKDVCCEHPLSAITYHVQMQRRTQASIFNYIVPCVFINMIGKLILTVIACRVPIKLLKRTSIEP